MANKTPALTIAFLEKHPTAAAKALAEMDRREAATFLEPLPTRVVCLMVSNMSASSASALLAQMAPVNTAAILRSQDYLWATSILRLIPAKRRAAILEECPVKLKRNLEKSLSFPPDTVGAFMTTSVIMLKSDNTVADAKLELAHAPKALAEIVFLIGEDRRLLGVVRTVHLFHQTDETRLGTLMENKADFLSARAKLSSVSDVPDWNSLEALPVVSRQKHLIGALTRSAVIKIQETPVLYEDHNDDTPVIVSLADAFLTSITGLFEILTGSNNSKLPVAKRSRP